MNPWETLGVTPDIAVADLRRRYAALIKEFRPETHPQDFARIREAYEIVLRVARQRAAEAPQTPETPEPADDAVAEATTVAPPEVAEAPIPDEVEIEDEIATADAAISAVLAQPAGTADEPGLADLFRQFHALAESAVGTRDEAFLPALRHLLRARTRSSLDDSQALEFALLRWFLEAEMPALTLLFETGRAFDWHGHESRLAAWLSPHAMRRIEGLLGLSRDLVYARRFSGNGWLRRLHSIRPPAVPRVLAWRPAVIEAQRWAERWQATSENVGIGLASCLDPTTLARLHGRVLFSTDVLAGLAVASIAATPADAAIAAVVATAASFAWRIGAGFVRHSPRARRLRTALAWADRHRYPVLGVLVALVLGLLMLLMDQDSGWALKAAVGVALAPLLLVPLILLGRLVAYVELLASRLVAWREAVDRLEFKRLLARPPAADEGGTAATASRLGWYQRLRAIPAARQLELQEIAVGARPARLKVGPSFGGGLRAQGWPRMLWIGLWVLFAVLRLAHLIGTN